MQLILFLKNILLMVPGAADHQGNNDQLLVGCPCHNSASLNNYSLYNIMSFNHLVSYLSSGIINKEHPNLCGSIVRCVEAFEFPLFVIAIVGALDSYCYFDIVL